MLIVALVMAVIGLAALVTAVVTSNDVIAWACIAASVIGVVLLIIDAVRERQRRDAIPEEARDAIPEEAHTEPRAEEGAEAPAPAPAAEDFDADYPEDAAAEEPKPGPAER